MKIVETSLNDIYTSKCWVDSSNTWLLGISDLGIAQSLRWGSVESKEKYYSGEILVWDDTKLFDYITEKVFSVFELSKYSKTKHPLSGLRGNFGPIEDLNLFYFPELEVKLYDCITPKVFH